MGVVTCWAAAAPLVLGTASLSGMDLARARQPQPSPDFRGTDHAHMSSVLNAHLLKLGGTFEQCEHFELTQLRALQQKLLSLADPSLLALYPSRDRRTPRRAVEAVEAHWQSIDAAELGDDEDDLRSVLRDGQCHEVILSLIHHLPAHARQSVLQEAGTLLPLLPAVDHRQRMHPEAGSAAAVALDEYAQQVSCTQCHTGAIEQPKWANATLPPPLPVDAVHPGRERLRSCDFQSQPPCGPCDGLGGPRWGDGAEEFTPLLCEPIALPSDIPPSERTAGRYPPLSRAKVRGGTRSPVAVRPDAPGNYSSLNATLYLGWANGAARQRYDFVFGAHHMVDASQLYLQTAAQQAANDTGVMVTLVPSLPPKLGGCTCERAIAGNMHTESFVAHEKLDPLDLPAGEGGLAYLGRVRVQLDDPARPNRTALADHWLKWAFHFLVDADETSPTHGLPLRLYGTLGVRQIFDEWQVGDPERNFSTVWHVPADCAIKTDACREHMHET